MKPKSGEIERKKILMSQQLRTMLEEGVYLPGAPLPGERTLAQQYGMNRMSVKAVLQELAEDGYTGYRERGPLSRKRCLTEPAWVSFRRGGTAFPP